MKRPRMVLAGSVGGWTVIGTLAPFPAVMSFGSAMSLEVEKTLPSGLSQR